MCNSRFIDVVPLSLSSVRRRVEGFLAGCGLRYVDMDYYVTVSTDEDGERILAGGGLDGNVIKCVAVSDEARSEGLASTVVSRLLELAREHGLENVKLFTKSSNADLFRSLGFRLLASTDEAILMEYGTDGLRTYTKYLESLRSPGCNGAIVMNANPFTRGHRYLIEQAASQVDHLYVIAVKEDKSLFPYVERKAMIEVGCADIQNVTVCEGSDYAVSSATFPTYFIKKIDDATEISIRLDLDLFVRHIAPALDISMRFAGSEEGDALTRLYNSLMASSLPAGGIDFVQIPRLSDAGVQVSASALRKALDEDRLSDALRLAYPTTRPYLLAELAQRALRIELDTSPKPGLVDRIDSGAHCDMDYALMSVGIDALRPYFTRIAVEAAQKLEPQQVRLIGIEAEEAMLHATGGVNTHKGALFCMGLALAAAAFLTADGELVRERTLRKLISWIADGIPSAEGTNGAGVVQNYRVGGALDNARRAYPQLFADWLPYWCGIAGDDFRCHKTLLRIMSSLDDTNVLHRRGSQGLDIVKSESRRVLDDFSIDALTAMNQEFIRENISPGGSADMLSLTIFISHIIHNTN